MGGCDRAAAAPWWAPSQESHTASAAQQPAKEDSKGLRHSEGGEGSVDLLLLLHHLLPEALLVGERVRQSVAVAHLAQSDPSQYMRLHIPHSKGSNICLTFGSYF